MKSWGTVSLGAVTPEREVEKGQKKKTSDEGAAVFSLFSGLCFWEKFCSCHNKINQTCFAYLEVHTQSQIQVQVKRLSCFSCYLCHALLLSCISSDNAQGINR